MQKSRYLRGLILISILSLLTAGVLAQDTYNIPDEDVLKQKYQKEIEDLKRKAEQNKNLYLQDAKKAYEEVKKIPLERYKQEAQELLRTDPQKHGRKSSEKQDKKEKIHLAEDERVYVFMSSSVPETVWKTYASDIDNYGLGQKVIMVIRGCIGGCTYVKPTLKFITRVLQYGSKPEDVYKAQVWIDPLLFKRYGIKEVPCFVYVKGLGLHNPELSEGLDRNISTTPSIVRKSCGDWAMEYHFRKLGLLPERKK